MLLDNIENVLHNLFIKAQEEFIRDNKTKYKEDDSGMEKVLNLRLFNKIDAAIAFGTILYECPIQPSKGDDSHNPSLKKVPDFTLRLVDSEVAERLDYHVECKRLDEPASTYCSAYITKGVMRFIDPDYRYGCFCDLGFMIGYLQNLTFQDAFGAVNKYASEKNIPALSHTNGNNETPVNTMEHTLNRKQKVSKFKLIHYWVDMKK